MSRVASVLDLTVAQVEAIETEVGLPVQRWKEAPSAARLLTSILAAVQGKPRDSYAGMTLRELMAAVDLEGDEDVADPEA